MEGLLYRLLNLSRAENKHGRHVFGWSISENLLLWNHLSK